MKAFILTQYDKKAPLQLVELPEPTLKASEVLVEVHAAGVNLLDAKLKAGAFKLILPYKLPMVLGHDVSGVITKVGRSVTKFKIGDEIFARPADFHIGTFAQFIAINEKDVALKPANISFEEAAAIPLVALTAWQAFIESAKLKRGQKVFIQAGSGGVGTLAIQLAKHLGAFVATTTSAKNVDLVKGLGADLIIDYKTTNFEDVLLDYDLVLNSQDVKTLEHSLKILKPGGRVISISGPPTPTFSRELNLPWLMRLITKILSRKIRGKAKKLGVAYTFLFMKASGEQLSKIAALINNHKINPVIDRVFPFEQTNEALAYVEKGRAKGKVVIKVKGSA